MTIHAPDGVDAVIDGKVFVGVSNSADGQVNAATRFSYHQQGGTVWADYAGGQVSRGHLVGTRRGDELTFRYVHLDVTGKTAGGRCTSRITVLPDGRVRLEESWAWESRPGIGISVVEEAPAL